MPKTVKTVESDELAALDAAIAEVKRQKRETRGTGTAEEAVLGGGDARAGTRISKKRREELRASCRAARAAAAPNRTRVRPGESLGVIGEGADALDLDALTGGSKRARQAFALMQRAGVKRGMNALGVDTTSMSGLGAKLRENPEGRRALRRTGLRADDVEKLAALGGKSRRARRRRAKRREAPPAPEGVQGAPQGAPSFSASLLEDDM